MWDSLTFPLKLKVQFFYETFEFGHKRIAQMSWLVSRLDGSDLGSEARWLEFWLGGFDLNLAWSDHGSIARIVAQWLRGSGLEMALTQDLSSVARSLLIKIK